MHPVSFQSEAFFFSYISFYSLRDPSSALPLVTELRNNDFELPFKTTEREEATVSLAATKEISIDAAVVKTGLVLLKEEPRTTLMAFLGRKDVAKSALHYLWKSTLEP